MKIMKLLLISLLLCSCVSANNEVVDEKKVEDKQKVSFLAVGDNLMHKQLIDEAYHDGTYDFIPYYSNMKSIISQADLSFINQETVLGGKEFGYSGYPLFNTPDEMAEALNDTGFDIINGSNNHILDKGEAGLEHSIKVFQQYEDMKYIGLKEKEIPVIDKNGIKIAFLSYNQYMNYDQKSDSYKSFDKSQMKEDVKEAKKISDFIIVSCHFGREYEKKPNQFQKEYAQYLADLGVDVIIGTHTHVLQDVKWLNGKNGHKTLVAYNLGNFISGMLEEDTQLGGMLTFDIIKDKDDINIENTTLVPLVNHYEVSNLRSIMNTRHGFTVYRLKDYTSLLASQHGLNGYKGISITVEKLKQKVKRISCDIRIDM